MLTESTSKKDQLEEFGQTELKAEQVKRWLIHFRLMENERAWHQVHVSGHGSGEQIKKVIDGANPKFLVPIHTEHEECYKEWNHKLKPVQINGSITL